MIVRMRMEGLNKMKRDIRLIALDMDGTLLNQNQEITDRNKKVISVAQERGIHVVLSTGRPFEQVLPYKNELLLDSYSITVNGGQIWDSSNKVIVQTPLTENSVREIWKVKMKYQSRYWTITKDRAFRNNLPEGFNFSDFTWLKFGFIEKDNDTRQKIKEEIMRHDIEVTSSSPVNVEVNAKGVNKAAALKKVCEQLNISMENVMAVGDSLNDLKMIQQAGIGIAMGNAEDIIKDVADGVTSTNENSGVAEAIEFWVLD